MKGGGGSAQQMTTESENLGSCNQPKREGDANNNNNEENLRKWRTNLDAACQGEKLSVGSAGGDEGSRRSGGCEGVTERIIPIAVVANKGNPPVNDNAKGGKVDPRSRVVPIV